MALDVHQRGYGVVSADREQISVKTVTSSQHVSFRRSTFGEVDRVMVLRLNIDEGEASIEEVFDGPASALIGQCKETTGDYQFILSGRAREPKRSLSEMEVSAQAQRGELTIKQYENGTIEVLTDGVPEPIAKPVLRDCAPSLVSIRSLAMEMSRTPGLSEPM